MELTYHRIDLAKCEAQGKTPGDVIVRGHANEIWYVPFSPLCPSKLADNWRYYKREQHVVIPMFRYNVPNNPVDALGYAFQLGVIAMHQLGGKPVRRLHLAIGDPVQHVVDQFDNSNFWVFALGVGIVLE